MNSRRNGALARERLAQLGIPPNVDISTAFIRRERAAELGVAGRVRFVHGDIGSNK